MHHAAAAASRWPHDPSATPLGKTHDEQPGTFRELADHCRDVVWVRDARNAELTYVNPAYRSLWGRDAEDARDADTGWTEAIHPDDVPRVVEALRPDALRRGFQEEYRLVHADETRWVHDRGVGVPDPDGVVRRIVGIAQDITERRALEQQLVGSQKLEGMGRLASGVAHDFNNLLTAILGYSESIVSQSDPRDPRRAEALEIQRAGEKAAALTRQLLAFSKRQALKMTVVDLNVIVRDVHQMLERLIGEHIAIEPRLAADHDGPLPAGAEGADVVTAVETIEHLENPRALVRQLVRLAKPGGWILLTTPNQRSVLSLVTLLLKGQFSAFQDTDYPAHITALLESDLRRIGSELGLTDAAIKYTGQGRLPLTSWHYPRALTALLPRALSDNLLYIARTPPCDAGL